ncbi:hypothetical protein ID866_10162 [Astraeus odoratus]|nr:hypothetical protein ID866_10162 [Astraeus odoratus]
MKTADWTKVPDEELVTNINNTDLVGNVKAWEKHRRLHAACYAEIWKAEEQEWKCQAEEVEKCQKEELLLQRPENGSGQIQKSRQAGAGQMHLCIKKRLACGSCTKAKERSEWPKVEMAVIRVATSPRGREQKKQEKKVDDDDDNDVVILSSQKTRWQGGGKMLEEISDQRWGELIQAVSTCMDMTNGHLEWIASMSQSNCWKMQWHHLMEGLVGQQQMLILKLVKMSGAARSGGATGVAEGQEELKELQGEESGGWEDETEGVPGGAPEGELEDAPGNEPGNGTGAEDGTGEEAQRKDKGKGKEKAL